MTIIIRTARSTVPDLGAALSAVRTALADDPTVRIDWTPEAFAYLVSRTSEMPLTADEWVATKAAIESVSSLTPQREAQNQIDDLPIVWKAIVLALLDQLNVLRARASLAEISPAQALAAIRSKANQL